MPEGTDEPRSAPRVLHLVASADRRGAEVFAEELVRRLAPLGVAGEIHALAQARPGAPRLDVEVTALRPHALPRLRRLARAHDVVVGHGSRGLPGSTLATWGRRRPTPVVYRSIGDPTRWGGTSPARRARVGLQLRRAGAVVALWPGAADAMADLYGIKRTRIVVIPNGVDAERFVPADPASRAAARRALGLGEGPVAVVVGAHGPEKRIPAAIEALVRVEGLQVLVAGDGPERARVDRAAAAAPDRVHVLGALDDVAPLYAAGDVLVSTSATEGQPGAVLEAALSGLAVVATDVGGTKGVAGPRAELVAPSAGPSAIAAAVIRALELPPTDASGLDELRSRFGLARVAEQWAELLVAVARTGRPPAYPAFVGAPGGR